MLNHGPRGPKSLAIGQFNQVQWQGTRDCDHHKVALGQELVIVVDEPGPVAV
jgi:hypothetical protein